MAREGRKRRRDAKKMRPSRAERTPWTEREPMPLTMFLALFAPWGRLDDFSKEPRLLITKRIRAYPGAAKRQSATDFLLPFPLR